MTIWPVLSFHRCLGVLAVAAVVSQSVSTDVRSGPAVPAQAAGAAIRPLLHAELEQREAAGTFSGAVVLARGTDVLYASAHGLADRQGACGEYTRHPLPDRVDEQDVHAVAILKLVQTGRVSLHAPLGTYLPDYPNRTVAATVTVHHLLTHTGGTGDIFGPRFESRRLVLRAPASGGQIATRFRTAEQPRGAATRRRETFFGSAGRSRHTSFLTRSTRRF